MITAAVLDIGSDILTGYDEDGVAWMALACAQPASQNHAIAHQVMVMWMVVM